MARPVSAIKRLGFSPKSQIQPHLDLPPREWLQNYVMSCAAEFAANLFQNSLGICLIFFNIDMP